MKKYEKWCSTFIQNLSSYLNLAGWEIMVEFSSDPKQDSEGCFADISCDSTYMIATVRIYPLCRECYDTNNMERLKRVLTHELCHILIDPIHVHILPFLSDTTRQFFNDDMENVTQRISLVVVKNLPKHITPPR